MMPALLAAFLIFQSAAVGPRVDPGGNEFGACPVHIHGQIIFPPYSQKVYSIAITLVPADGTSVPIEETALPYLQFDYNVTAIPGTAKGLWQVVIQVPGMDLVRQDIPIALSDCRTTLFVQVPLRISPAIKPSPIEEDTVGIESLVRKTPGNVESAFEKSLEHEPKVDPGDTAAILQKILKTNPDYYEANLEIGLEYRKQNKTEEAKRALTHAVEVNSGSMRARSALGQYSIEAGDYQKAAELLSEAVRLGSASSEVYYMLGAAYYKLDQFDLAEASLTRALSLSPDLAKAHLQLYNVFMKKRQPKQALKEMETYLELSPDADNRSQIQSIIDRLRKP